MRWDRKKLLESNLHVYGKDDTQIPIYSMKRSQKGKGKGLENELLKKELFALD